METTSREGESGLSESEVALLRGHLERAWREAKARLRREEVAASHAEPQTEAMDAGTYGVSELSGDPIGFARLEAVPWARVTTDESEDA